MRALTLIASAFLPGAGHIVVGKQLKGVLLALGYTLALMTALFRMFVVWPEGSVLADAGFLAAAGACLVLWIWAFAGAYDTAIGLRRSASREEVDKHFRDGAVQYLRGNLLEAERLLSLAARLAPRDVDVRMHLARVYRNLGIRGKQRRLLRKCRALDADGKWAAEIEEALNESDE